MDRELETSAKRICANSATTSLPYDFREEWEFCNKRHHLIHEMKPNPHAKPTGSRPNHRDTFLKSDANCYSV